MGINVSALFGFCDSLPAKNINTITGYEPGGLNVMKTESVMADPCLAANFQANTVADVIESVRSIFDKIVRSAREHQFDQADALRHQLFTIDRDAVQEIDESGRIIEKAKKQWEFEQELIAETGRKCPTEDSLTSSLSYQLFHPAPNGYDYSFPVFNGLALAASEENRLPLTTNARSYPLEAGFKAHWFYFVNGFSLYELEDLLGCMRRVNCNEMKRIIRKGRKNTRLFFIESGTVRVSRPGNSGDEGLTLHGGDIVGDVSFFNGETSPYDACAYKDSDIKYIEYSDLRELKSVHRNIDRILYSLCISHITSRNTDSSVQFPRFYRRYNIAGTVSAVIQKESGKTESEPFRGTLVDISYGGLSFDVRVPGSTFRETIIGSSIRVTVHSTSPSDDTIDWNGTVVGVSSPKPGHVSLHVKGRRTPRNVCSLIRNYQHHTLFRVTGLSNAMASG